MKFDLKTLAATSALALGVSQAYAVTPIGEYASVSGFGTTGVVRSDTDDAEFVRHGQPSGATDDLDFEVDSNLGLQVNARANRWLSGTVQLLTKQREDENMSTKVEWAFVGIEPVDRLRVRIGRTAIPTFAISDARNVGYANTWVRPPDEVYGLALIEHLDGIDVSYDFPIGDTSLTLTALAGESVVHTVGIKFDMEDVRGLTAQWETPWANLRLGHIAADTQLDNLGLAGQEDRYTFSGAGVFVDRANVVARAEYVTRRSEDFGDFVDANGWYAFGGYRFGNVLPYAIYATSEPKEDYLPVQISGEQSTIAAGVRWDAFSSAAIKFQLDRVDTHDTHGVSFVTPTMDGPLGPMPTPVNGTVTVASISVDFVF